MSQKIKFGIGFVTGRSNVCNILNTYYKDMIEQINKYKNIVEITVYILFDMSYQNEKREYFYKINPEVYKNLNIVYITPEDIEKELNELNTKNSLNRTDLDFFFGYGHAKGRNTIMYFALKDNLNYLLFWDDDEYPVAVIKENGTEKWIKQDNILKHLIFMDKTNADITIGNHCGYISPIPYINFTEGFKEEDLKNFIEAISNDIISWDIIKEKMLKNNGVTFADKNILNGLQAYEIKKSGAGKWISGSTLCLNLNNIKKIPAFYNPPLARGEDTFFSTLLEESKIYRIPVYHFHDGFLKYTDIMSEKYPKTLKKIYLREKTIKLRFLNASIGWIKYKPLLLYIIDKKQYKQRIEEMKTKLNNTVPKLNKLFGDESFTVLLEELEKYDKEVQVHYNEYKKANKIWIKLKKIVLGDKV